MQSTQEIWKEIPGLENRYEVSNIGRIKNKITGHILKTPLNKTGQRKYGGSNGYKRFSVITNKNYSYYYVHRVVMMAFSPIPDTKGMVVNHKDFDTTNNCLSNLEWCTQEDNHRYSRDRGRYEDKDKMQSHFMKTLATQGKNWLVNRNTGNLGEKANSAKLKNEDILKIRELRKMGYTLSLIGRQFGVSHQTISSIVLGKKWSHVS